MTPEMVIAILGAGGLSVIVPKVIDGIRAWQSGRADEEKAQNRTALGRLATAELERDEEANFRRRIEDWAGELVYMLKQIGVPVDQIPKKPAREKVNS
jgi:hypothetical protein